MKHINSYSIAKLLIVGSMTALSTQAMASAFMLHEASASLLGEFYAGNAAISEDASTNFFNAAGLTQLEGTQLSLGAVNISTYGDFVGTVRYTAGGTLSGTGTAKNGASRLVPNLHASKQLGEKFAAGLSVTAPWGLATEYPDTAITRYQATYSELKTMNISPSVAFKPIDWLSLGVGFDALYGRAELDGVSGNGFTSSSDSQSVNRGNGWGYGWHLGALATLKQGTKLGINFRSEVDLTLKGKSKLVGPLNPSLAESHNLESTVTLPWYIDASVTQPIGDQFTVLGTVEYIQWSTVKELKLKGVQSVGGAQVTSTDPLNYKNSWTFLLGGRYKMNDAVMFKAGVGYDMTPTTEPERTITIPDANRWILAAGVRWFPKAADKVFVDVGYSHLFPQTADINKTKVGSTQTTNALGHVDGGANLFGAQLSVRM